MTKYLCNNIEIVTVLILISLFFFSCKDVSEEQEGIKEVVTNDSTLKIADSLYYKGHELYSNRSFTEAITTYGKADSLYQRLDIPKKVIFSKIRISDAKKFLFKPTDSVQKTLNEALVYAQNKDPKMFERGMLNHRLALCYMQQMDMETSKKYQLRALEIFNDSIHANDVDLLKEKAKVYQYLSFIEEHTYNFESAEKYALKTLELTTKAGIDSTKAYASLVSISIKLLDSDKVETLLKRAEDEDYFKDAPLYNTFDFYQWKANYLIDTQQYDEALQTLFELNSIVENSAFKDHYSGWYLNYTIAQTYLKKGDHEMAIQMVTQNEPDITGLNAFLIKEAESRDYLLLSDAYYKRGDTDLAKQYTQKAIKNSFSEEDQPNDFFDTLNLEKVHPKNVGMYSKLLAKAQLCTNLFQETGKQSYFEASLYTYELLHQYTKELGSRSDEDQFIGNDDFIFTYESLLKMYHKQWLENPAEELFFKALNINDESKTAKVLNELKTLRQEKLYKNIKPEILLEEKKIRKEVDSIRLLHDAGKRIGNTNLSRSKDSLEAAFITFKEQLKREYPSYHTLKYGVEASIAEIIAEKYENENLLSFFYGHENIYVFQANGNVKRFDTIALTEELQEHITTLETSVRNPGSSQYLISGVKVYEEVFKKYMDTTKRTIVVLDGMLQSIPLESLVLSNEGTPSFLLKKTQVVRLNSIKQGFVRAQSAKGALIFAPFANASNGEKSILPSSLEEAKEIKSIFGGTLKVNEEASKEAFVDNASKFSLLHLATHSEINKNAPLKSIIYFSGNENQENTTSTLKIEELYNMKLNSDLITLSSCETGVGKDVKGKGVQSISNAFNYAGVSSTVMSLWKVPDKETTQIMTSFYSHLSEGLEKDLALRNAKLAYLNSTTDPALRHPYYWAGFVISGDTSPIEISTPFNGYVVLGALILGLVGFGYYLRKKRKKTSLFEASPQ